MNFLGKIFNNWITSSKEIVILVTYRIIRGKIVFLLQGKNKYFLPTISIESGQPNYAEHINLKLKKIFKNMNRQDIKLHDATSLTINQQAYTYVSIRYSGTKSINADLINKNYVWLSLTDVKNVSKNPIHLQLIKKNYDQIKKLQV